MTLHDSHDMTLWGGILTLIYDQIYVQTQPWTQNTVLFTFEHSLDEKKKFMAL